MVQVAVFGTLGISIIFIGTIVFVLQALKLHCHGNAISNNCQCSWLEYKIHCLLQKLGIVIEGAGDTDKDPLNS